MKEGPAKAAQWRIFCFLILGGAWAGGSCSGEHVGDDRSTAASTGSTGTTTGGPHVVTTSNGGHAPCLGGTPDGHCDIGGGEDCPCEDCTDTAFCTDRFCRMNVDAGDCEPTIDACTCPQCDTNHYCNNPTQSKCIFDGTCESRYEGCTCEDCKLKNDDCKDNVEKCNKAEPNAGCEDSEPCECVDCFGTPRCVLPCTDNGGCDSSESCACPDCLETEYCTDLGRCKDDGICDIIVEGCVCADCKDISPACAPAPMSDAGTMAQSGASAASGAGGGM